ncbi:MAG: SRPBCC family protein [Acidobacteriaceae bacterium]
MRHTFCSEQWVPYPVELVFAFFANPENLPCLMPRWQKARIEEAQFTPPPPRPQPQDSALWLRSFAAGAGSRMTISFRPFPYSPMRLPWEARITDFVWNDHFCDTQPRGPFAYWNHCHRVLSETRDGIPGTLVVDDLEYELPFGGLGEFAHKLFVRKQIGRMFAYRQTCLLQILQKIQPRP